MIIVLNCDLLCLANMIQCGLILRIVYFETAINKSVMKNLKIFSVYSWLYCAWIILFDNIVKKNQSLLEENVL